MKKTNAARILDGLGIKYSLHTYEYDESDLSAGNAASKIGLPPEKVFKTLAAVGDKTGVIMACIPADSELDLKALAAVSGNKKTDMLPLKDVLPTTGYMRGGVSPIGAKKNFPVFIDESALKFDFISVSAGHRGCQMFIAPADLIKAANASTAALAR